MSETIKFESGTFGAAVAAYADTAEKAERLLSAMTSFEEFDVAVLAAEDLREAGAKAPHMIAAKRALGMPDDEQEKTGPRGAQKRSVNGRRFRKLGDQILKNMTPAEKPFRLAVVASGDNGPVTGTVTVPEDHPLYADLVAFIAEAQAAVEA